jgi:hypothetical protein
VHALTRRILVPFALTTLALTSSGCSTSSGDAGSGPAAGAASTAGATPADEPRELDVAATPTGAPTPTAVARERGGSGARQSSFKVASFDKRTGRTVISKPQPTSPSGTAAATPPAADAGPVRTGDVIASAPVPGAPDGLLVQVAEVVGETSRGTEVTTRPATLRALLADDKAEGQVPIDPAAMEAEPLVQGVKVSWAGARGTTFGPKGAKLPLGSLRLDVGAAIATAEGAPASAAASVNGYVELAPEVEFSYNGSTRDHFLGLTGDWTAQWALKGRAAGGVKQRIPFAKLHADPVIQVGLVPVVVNLDLTCYIQVEADGRITLDVEQKVTGDFRVGAGYTSAEGWSPESTSHVKSSPVNTTVTAAGRAQSTFGAEASVGLYGMAGVMADFAPYLRGDASATATASTKGKASVVGTWALHGGFNLSGNLQFQLSIFGTPVFSHSIPVGRLHREWRLAGGEGGATATPSA